MKIRKNSRQTWIQRYMAKVEKINRFNVKSGDCFFFDNNVWMILFSPISGVNRRQQDAYGTLLKQIQSSRATIYINSLIVSEYMNRSLRLAHSIWADNERRAGNCSVEYKKYFRDTYAFCEAQRAACAEMRDILSIAERKPDDFNAVNLEEIMNTQAMDFNDAYYTSYCSLNNLILVSDDKDLQRTVRDITILTA